MTDPYNSPPYPSETPATGGYASPSVTPPVPRYASSLASTTKDEAVNLAGTAKDAAGSVLDAEKTMARDTAEAAADQAKATLAEAKVQVGDLWQQSRSEISAGAGVQLQRLATGARTLSDELSSMASASQDPGIASDLARRAAGYLTTATEWIETRGPDEVLTDVKQFARRSPGTFIAIAAGLGLVAGRVTRSLKSAAAESDGTDAGPVSGSARPVTPAVPSTTGYDAPASDPLGGGGLR